MRRVMWFLLVCMCAGSLMAAGLDARYQEAGQAYKVKQYDRAYERYLAVERDLRSEGVRSFDVAFNLGCTAFRMGNLADARYWFETARRLRPGDPDVERNLAVVISKLTDKVNTPPKGYVEARYRELVSAVPYNGLALLVLLCLLACAGFGGLLVAGRLRRKPLWYGFSVSLVLLALSLALLNSRAGDMTRPEAVIMAAEVDVFSEPNTSSSLLFRLHAGTLVTVEDSEGGYLHIALPDGMNGWARSQDMKRIQ